MPYAPTAEAPPRIEDKTISPIPAAKRRGSAYDLFTLWFGSNITVLTVGNGALATAIYGQPFLLAVLGLVAGNLAGAVLVALHSAQGPLLGVPQMVQTRAQFGLYGALLVMAAVTAMYVGFLAANLAIADQSFSVIAGHRSTEVVIGLVAALSLIASVFGYDLIHSYARVISYAGGTLLLLTFAWIVAAHHLEANFWQAGRPGVAGFMGTVTVAALWQVACAPYASDYSRYLNADAAGRPVLRTSYAGCALGSIVPMVLGAMIGVQGSDVAGALTTLAHGIAFPAVGMLTISVATNSAMSVYSGALSVIAIGQTFFPRWLPRAATRSVLAVVIVAIAAVPVIGGRGDLLVSYTNFVLLLTYMVVPWAAINLVDFYLIRHGNYDVRQFFLGNGGIYGRFSLVAAGCYLAGIAIEVPFVNTAIFEGPVATSLRGVDVSWIVCLAVVGPLYYVTATRLRLLPVHAHEAVPSPERAWLNIDAQRLYSVHIAAGPAY
jgi:NCS1 family nucleobase:cation symporter-1